MTYSRNAKRDLLGKKFVLGNLKCSEMKEVENETKEGGMSLIGQRNLVSINGYSDGRND